MNPDEIEEDMRQAADDRYRVLLDTARRRRRDRTRYATTKQARRPAGLVQRHARKLKEKP